MAGRVYQYAGVRAGEATLRWAAFFDAAGWSWSYRSHDLGGYAPPFCVTIPALDDAWATVVPMNRFDDLVARSRRELEQVRLEGYALALGQAPLGRDVLGGVALYPRPAWEPLTTERAGLARPIGEIWREAQDFLRGYAVADLEITPEIYGGTRLPDWRSRGEAHARRWGSPEEIRDWGLIISEIGAHDPLVAGLLSGASRARVSDDSIDIWFPAHSLRTVIFRALGSRPRSLLDRLFHLPLQVLLEAEDDPS